jgi:hypothetical protein
MGESCERLASERGLAGLLVLQRFSRGTPGAQHCHGSDYASQSSIIFSAVVGFVGQVGGY